MRTALLLVALAASGFAASSAAAQTDAAEYQRALAEFREELRTSGLSEDDQEYVYYCVANDRTPEAEARCDAQRLLAIFLRYGLTPGDLPDAPEAPEGLPPRTTIDPATTDSTRYTPVPDVGPMFDPGIRDTTRFGVLDEGVWTAAPTQTRYAVAYGPEGGWVVASGVGGMVRIQVPGQTYRPQMLVSDDLEFRFRQFLGDFDAARAITMGHAGAAVLTTAAGAFESVNVRDFEIQDPRIDAVIEDFNRDRRGSRPRSNTGGPSPQQVCDDSYDVLADALEAESGTDGQVVLQPGTCRWLLVAGGRAEEGPDEDPGSAESSSWANLQRAVQARLDAGERPAIGITPETEVSMQSWVVITDTQVDLGPDLPASFRSAIQQAQSESFSVTGRGSLEPVGTVHAIAFDPERFAIGTDGRQVVTGWIMVGDGAGGYRAHGVSPEACEAAREVTGGTGSLNCQAPVENLPEPLVMSPSRNKVAVLIHGITSPPQNAPSEGIGTMRHTGYYWGYDFISGVVGDTYKPNSDHALQMTTTEASGVLAVTEVTRGAWNRCGGITPASGSCPVSDGGAPGARGRLAPVFSRFEPAWTEPDANRSGYGWTAAMVTFRDGSRHLAEQLPAAIDQIYDTYQAHFGALPADQQPQLYLVGHSYGGVISRALTTPMDPADPTPLAPTTLTPEQRRRAAFLRDRTVLVGTLSTPHEGAPTPDYANTMTDMADALADAVKQEIDDLPDILFSEQPAISVSDLTSGGGTTGGTEFGSEGRLGSPTRGEAKAAVSSGLAAAQAFISGYRDVFDDINAQATANQTFLAPTRAVRTDGSAIPLYTMSGRLSGDRFFWLNRGLLENTGIERFDRLNVAVSRLDMVDVMRSGRAGMEAGGLLAIEMLIQRLGIGESPGHPWGRSSDPAMDKTSTPRYSQPGPVGGLATEAVLLAERLLSYRHGYGLGPDGDVDSDGFVSVASGHGVGLNAPAWYRTHTGYGGWMPWDVDNHGSLMFNPGNGAWIHNHLLRGAGPLAAPGPWSAWPDEGAPRPSERSVTVEVNRIRSSRDVDPLRGTGEADLHITVQVGDTIERWEAEDHGMDDDNDIRPSGLSVTHRTTSTIVPIRISLRDVDGGAGGEDDHLGLAPSPGREVLYAYVDLRTNEVFGDVYGSVGVGGAAGPDIFAMGLRGTNVPHAAVWLSVSAAY